MNPNTKVYEMGRLSTRFHKQPKRTKVGRYTTFKSKLRRALYILKVTIAILAINAAIIATGVAALTTTEVTASTQTILQMAPSPIMDRIADCESGNGTPNSATQTRKGQVLISLNTNGTYDQGKYQINSIHNAEATALGYNLATEEGNTAYAKYLYATKGTGDWASSAHCWQH